MIQTMHFDINSRAHWLQHISQEAKQLFVISDQEFEEKKKHDILSAGLGTKLSALY